MHLSRALVRACLLVAVVTCAAAGCTSGAAAPPSGATLFESCLACHGDAGGGNAAIGAPAIAGLPQWYVSAQLEKFQQGLRGRHADDAEGLRMRAMARMMMSPEETAAVSAHVASLPPVKTAATLSGASLSEGETAFALCAACHGMKGEGNEVLKAPPLAGLDDWYVASQIRKFKAGIRGTAVGDATGPIMQATSMAIQPEQVNDLAAYVHSLPR